MSIDPNIIAAYSPWSNAQLSFEVQTTTYTTDSSTGNYIPDKIIIEYLASLTIQPPDWRSSAGTDQTTYNVSGRLLSPSTLDSRIVNGSQALALVNGLTGRFELIFDLSMDAVHRSDLRQLISGIFRVTGGGQ